MKKNVKSYVMAGLTVCALGFGGCLTAMAQDSALLSPPGFAEGEIPEPPFGGGRGGATKMDFSGFVTDGVIDQATADKITAYMEERFAERKAGMEEMKDMTESERKAFFESHANKKGEERPDMFAGMVSDGVITQEQADAMKAAMPQPPDMDGEPRMGGMVKMDFSNLVADGVLDQATADNMIAFMEERSAQRKAEMESMKDITESERKALFESNKGEQKGEQRQDIFADMVSAGVITQEQADAIKAAMPQPQKRGAKVAAEA